MTNFFYSNEISSFIIDALLAGFDNDPAVNRVLKFNLFAQPLDKMNLDHLFPAIFLEYIGLTNFWHDTSNGTLVTLYNYKLTYVYPNTNMEVEDEINITNKTCEKIANVLFGSDICATIIAPTYGEQGGIINEIEIKHMSGARSGNANVTLGGIILSIATLDLTIHFNTYASPPEYAKQYIEYRD